MGGINPGELRDRITVTRLVRTSDGRGGENATEEVFFNAFAKVTPMRPITGMVGDKMNVIQPYSVIIRYSLSRIPEADMKVTYNNKSYLIQNIVEVDSRKRLIQFMITKAL